MKFGVEIYCTCGPLLTTRYTVDPALICSLAAGLVLMTESLGTSDEVAFSTSTVKPAF